MGRGGIHVRAGIGDGRDGYTTREAAAAAGKAWGDVAARRALRRCRLDPRSRLGLRYVGIDIVPDLVERQQAAAAAGEIEGDYRLADITRDPLPRCDAILCRDCLVHLSFANIERAVGSFRRSGATWLIATTFPGWQTNRDCEDGDWRALNLERSPFDWAAPVELLNENCTEAGGGWRDKSLGVWRLS
jgi:hypothetical protein